MGWSVTEDPATAAVVTDVETRSPTGQVFTQGVSSRGITRPFRRDEKNDFASASGAELVVANVGQILGTVCNGPAGQVGELPWRPEFGSLLQVLRLRNNSPVLADQARAFVSQAVKRWEPRCRVTGSSVVASGTTLRISVRWDLLASADSNRVLVSGLETTAAVG